MLGVKQRTSWRMFGAVSEHLDAKPGVRSESVTYMGELAEMSDRVALGETGRNIFMRATAHNY